MSKYYKIIDKGLIGRQDSMFECFLYDHTAKKWIPDTNNILMDRLIGYDGESVGSVNMLSMAKEITESEALKSI